MSNLSNIQLLIIALVVIIGVIVAMEVIIPLLKKKGINVQGVLQETETALEDAGTAIEVVEEFTPSKALNTINTIRELALDATKEAQQLSISSQLPLAERRQKAKTSIINGLNAFKIPVTPQIEKLIDTIIERMVFDSKTPEEQKAQEQNAYQKQIADLQTQLQQQAAQSQNTINQLYADKTALQQKIDSLMTQINNVQAAVTSTQVTQ